MFSSLKECEGDWSDAEGACACRCVNCEYKNECRSQLPSMILNSLINSDLQSFDSLYEWVQSTPLTSPFSWSVCDAIDLLIGLPENSKTIQHLFRLNVGWFKYAMSHFNYSGLKFYFEYFASILDPSMRMNFIIGTFNHMWKRPPSVVYEHLHKAIGPLSPEEQVYCANVIITELFDMDSVRNYIMRTETMKKFPQYEWKSTSGDTLLHTVIKSNCKKILTYIIGQ